jgi:leader peptidase (prepilin peptidase) / N-methyltransferase
VVYRLPRGQSLAYPGSRCPACAHAIRWYHNLPMVSWLLLRGRCHDCGAKISSRYPLVELTSALLFVGLALLEVWPVRQPPLSGRELLARWVYHVWLLETLLAAALIERDGCRVPPRLFWLALAIGLAGAAAFPAVQAKFARVTSAAWPLDARWEAVAQAVAGGAIGMLAGWVYSLAGKVARSRSADGTYYAAAACVGVFLGWQAIVLGGLIATAIWLLLEHFAKRRSGIKSLSENRLRRAKRTLTAGWGWSGPLLAASLGWIVAARLWIDFLPVWLP